MILRADDGDNVEDFVRLVLGRFEMSLTTRMLASCATSCAFWAVALSVAGCDQLFPSSGTGAAGSSGAAGSTGTGAGGAPSTGTGNTTGTVMKDPSNYPQTAGAGFPYPQGHTFARCPFPAYDTDKVATAYNNWKAKFFQGGRVVRTENTNDTASEGIAYGMLMGVYMNDQGLFDTLWGYAHARLNGNGLMTWHYSAAGAVVDGPGAATDADQDMAWALLMADKQWGGSPTTGGLPSYASSATTLIGAIWSKEVDQSNGFVLKPGDMFGGANQTNPSYFAPSYYRVFATATSNPGWLSVVTSSYSILSKASGSSGLVPNWVNSQGLGVNGPGNDPNGLHFGYDACRIPWRIALDYCENGEPQAMQYLQKIVGFYTAKFTAGGGLGSIKDGYTVAGAAPPPPLGMYAAGMAFTGPAGVAALYDGGAAAFVNSVYLTLVADITGPQMTASGIFSYYNGSWGVLSLLTMSGNFWNLTH
jgi:endo-1,4-beta-D-glucanase Y